MSPVDSGVIELHKLVAIDGQCFDLAPCAQHDSKNFVMRFPELCSRDSYIVRLWYTTTVDHCAAYGVFLPHWASLRDTTMRQGFNCGDGTDDDIPKQFSTKIPIWDQQLANGLSNSTKSIQIHDLKGYPYIHHLIKSMDPSFVHRPSDLILQRPMQFKTKSIQEFFLRT